MKKAFLYAYDRVNLGDDLFVRTLVRRYPDVQFYMWSDQNNRRIFADMPNLKVIDRDSKLLQLLHRLRPSLPSRYKAWLEKRCRAVVYIGGSIFMEYPNWETICTWWEYEAANRPFYVLGANFGPWRTEAYRQKMDAVFANCQDVCFRDRYSQSLFVQNPRIRQVPDILFAYPMPKAPVKEKQVFVSVIHCAGRDESHDLSSHDQTYTQNMAALLQTYLADGHQLVLASFCKEEGDEEGIRKILEAMGLAKDPRIRVLAYDGTNWEAITSAIAESGYVIATRFHATILAMAAGRPVLPVVYSDKTVHVLADLGFTGTVFDLRKNAPWSHPDSRSNGDAPVPLLSHRIKEDAQLHFAKLDEVLK